LRSLGEKNARHDFKGHFDVGFSPPWEVRRLSTIYEIKQTSLFQSSMDGEKTAFCADW
jgi:hypothetical protein